MIELVKIKTHKAINIPPEIGSVHFFSSQVSSIAIQSAKIPKIKLTLQLKYNGHIITLMQAYEMSDK